MFIYIYNINYYKKRDLTNNKDIQKQLLRGRWYLKELQSTITLHKYRNLKGKYYNND